MRQREAVSCDGGSELTMESSLPPRNPARSCPAVRQTDERERAVRSKEEVSQT